MYKVGYIGSLILTLEELKNSIIMSSNISVGQRSHAISEIFYYTKLLDSFFEYAAEDQAEILLGVIAMHQNSCLF